MKNTKELPRLSFVKLIMVLIINSAQWVYPTYAQSSIGTGHLTTSKFERDQNFKNGPYQYTCAKGWHLHKMACYRWLQVPMSQHSAQLTCQSFGAQLVKIKDQQTNDLIGNRAQEYFRKNDSLWTGLTARYENSSRASYLAYHYTWSDGEPNSEYAGFWDISEPQLENGVCVYMKNAAYESYTLSTGTFPDSSNLSRPTTNFAWYIGSCDSMMPFVCQLPACLEGQYHCANAKCIKMDWRCDREDDCGDNSDEYDCPNQYTYYLEGTSGQIQSPRFPAPYPSNAVCQWVLEGPVGSQIELHFTTFETEKSFDIVLIRAGGRTKATSRVLVELSGDGKNEEQNDGYHLTVNDGSLPLSAKGGLTYLSPNHFMMLKLTSDGSTQFQGFSAKWTARTDLRNCGSVMHVQVISQPLFSPNYPENFPSGLECVYKLKASVGEIINLEIAKMELTSGDVFLIRDGLESTDTLLFASPNNYKSRHAFTSDSNIPTNIKSSPKHIFTTAQDVSIYFFSELFVNDLSSTNGATSRFQRKFHINYKLGCSDSIIAEYGHLASPGLGITRYPPNKKCEWEIISADGNPITLILHAVDIIEDGDYLEISHKRDRQQETKEYVQRKGKNDLVTKIVAPTNGPRRYRAEDGRVHVTFYSNEVGNGFGWNMTYSIDCPELAIPKHAEVFEQSQGNAYGAYKLIRCEKNFDFIKPVNQTLKVICLAGGKWNVPVIPRCGPKYCGPVPLIDNGYVVQADKVTYGGVSIYECYQGFHFPNNVPRQLITCTDDGWSNAPSCLSSTCHAYPKLNHGDINLITGDGLSFGSVLTFTCILGYNLIGPDRAMCTTNGSWDFSDIKCQAVKCPLLPPIANGEYERAVSTISFSQSLRVLCHRGFKMVSENDSITCMENGTLTAIPDCQDVDECSDPDVAHQCDSHGTHCKNVNGSYECTCAPGYRGIKCISIISCESMSTALGLSNGQVEDYQIQASDDDGVHTKSYVRLGSSLSWCGTIEKPEDNWIMVDFLVPKIIDHIRIQAGKRMDGSKGFVKLFSLQYTNDKSGELTEVTNENDEVIKFRGTSVMGKEEQSMIKLPKPIEARYIYLIIQEYEYAPCMQYELYGCQRMMCQDIDECSEIPELCNPLCTNTPGSYQCFCLPGYVLFTSNGSMENYLPPGETGLSRTDTMRFNHTCLRVLCPKLHKPENGILITNVTNSLYYYTESVEFQCDIGFQLTGERFIKCMADADWNYPAPTCEPIKCRNLMPNPPADGYIVMPSIAKVSYGQNITIDCYNPKFEDEFKQVHTDTPSSKRNTLGTAFSSFRQCVFNPLLFAHGNFQGDFNVTQGSIKNSLVNIGQESIDDIYWMSGNLPKCHVIDCGTPIRIAGAEYFFKGNSTQIGSNFLLTCKPPYQLSGSGIKENDRVYCEENGAWNFGSLICEGPICSDPGTPAGGKQIASSYDEGQIVNFTCNRRGFEPEHDLPSLKCVFNPACPHIKDLGLTSGYIPNQSILVSSALPGYTSNYIRMNAPKAWCGNEYAPSARIDLVDPTEPPIIIMAIRARGYVDSSVMGQISSFRFNYSLYPGVYNEKTPTNPNSIVSEATEKINLTTATGYIMHPEIFTLPQHPVAIIRTFVLSKPIVARSIILETLDFNELPCIKLEILGCKERDVYYKATPANTNFTGHSLGNSHVTHLRKKSLVGWNKPTPYCVDTEPPFFTNCPKEPIYVSDVVTNERGDVMLRMAYFDKPKAVDNFGIVGYLEAPPFVTSPFYMSEPEMEIIYTALDPTGNQATCVIQFIVKDKVPPILACPLSYNRDFESELDSLNITFSSDVFGVTDDYLKVTSLNDTVDNNHKNFNGIAVRFDPPWAVVPAKSYKTVQITAWDKFNNTASCSYHVAVQAQKCAPWSISNITNGAKICTKPDPSTTQCVFQCNQGYRFTDLDNDHKSVKCHVESDWIPHPNVPDCVILSDKMADYQIVLNVTYVSEDDLFRKECVNIYGQAFKAKFDEIEQQLTALCSLGKLSVKAKFIGADITPISENQIFASYYIRLIAPKDVYVLLNRCTSTISLLTNLGEAPIAGLMEMPRGFLDPNQSCPSIKMTKSRDRSPSVDHILKCPDGHIIVIDGGIPFCISCSAGMYAANNETCKPCPLGYYQNNPGQNQCIKCPAQTHTQYVLSKSLSDCLAICSNGTYSPTGLVPCQVCPHNTFSGLAPSNGIRECIPCPADTFTEGQGTIMENGCKSSCSPGHFSASGLEKCLPCPVNTYQDKPGQIFCEECAEELYTVVNASVSITDCLPVNCKKNCMNDGFCKVLYHKEVCVCPSGFTGLSCEVNIDECSLQPCYNGGTCHDGSNGFSCSCPKGFSGYRCEIGTDHCKDIQCPPSSMCQSLTDSYKCLCRKGFTGTLCNETINSCIDGYENPCLNGGLCNPAPLDRFTCSCQPGWTGRYCQINIDDCAEKPCLLGAKCIDLHMDFECKCPRGFNGKRCEIKEDLCATGTGICNNGTCVDRYFYHECVCPYGYIGKSCETNVNECAFSPCQNGGTCQDLDDNYMCVCMPGFTGLDCQHNINDCADSPCLNNGICIDGVQNYTCECLQGTSGSHCEIDINECESGPCNAEGTLKCRDTMGDYICECRYGYTGHECEIDIDDCLTDPCLNGGTCIDKVDGFECQCATGWTGDTCNSIIELCPKMQCKNGGKCYNMFSDYFCSCVPGYSGKDCSSSPNLCAGQPCINGGTCVNKEGSMKCLCTPSFYGKGCEKLRNPCDAHPCQNGGSCKEVVESLSSNSYTKENEPSSYICQCLPGFEGIECQDNIDDCQTVVGEPSKCPDFAKCIDGIKSFSCQCPYNSTGPNCDKEIDVMWDLYVNGIKSRCGAYQQSPQVLKSHSVSIGLWIRFLDYNGKGHFFTLWETTSDHSLTARRELIKIDHMGVYFNFYKETTNQAILFSSNSNSHNNLINDGQWHHLMVTVTNTPQISYDVILDGVRITSTPVLISEALSPFRLARRKNDRYPEYVWITLGSVMPEDVKMQDSSPDAVLREENKPTSDNNYFRGYISRVNLWGRLLDYDSEIPKQSVNCFKAPVLYDSLVARWADYRMINDAEKIPTNCGNHLCEEGRTEGSLCDNLKLNKITPKIIDCPSDITVTTAKRGEQVHWPTVKILNSNKMRVESSHESGSYFAIGTHTVSILVKDTSGNVDWCYFTIYINSANKDCKKSMPSQKVTNKSGPGNYVLDCGKWGPESNFAFCNIRCRDPYTTAFSVPVPKFYTCGHEGTWRPNMDEEFPHFPTCSSFKRAEKDIHMTAVFSTKGPCNYAGKQEIGRRIRKEVALLNNHWEMLCQETSHKSAKTCLLNEIKVDVACSNEGQNRRKRQPVSEMEFRTYLKNREELENLNITHNNYYLINMEFTSINDPLKNRMDQRYLPLKDILMGHFYLSNGLDFESTLPGVSAMRDEFNLSITPRCFKDGQVLINDKCVNCTLGTSLDLKSKACVPCPKNTYQDVEGSYGQCKQCPLIKNKLGKTAAFGSVSINDCKESCPPGQYYSLTEGKEGCHNCGYGYYQSDWGAFKCNACPTDSYVPIMMLYGFNDKQIEAKSKIPHYAISNISDMRLMTTILSTSTIFTNSTSINDCIEDCDSGMQFDVKGACQKCTKGTYRTRVLDERCVLCPSGFTTPSEGSKFVKECTIPICSPGYFLKTPINICVPCPVGQYQPSFEMDTCIMCPEDHITLKEGSDGLDDCLSTNECEIGTAKCVANSTCFNTQEGYDCACNEGFVGDAFIYCNDTNECRLGIHKCHKFADCHDTSQSYQCHCRFGYIGDGYMCTDSCESYCMNGGICRKNEFNIQYCECSESFSGLICADRNRARELKFIVGGISGSAVLLVLVVFVIWMICVKNTSAKNKKAAQSKNKKGQRPTNGFTPNGKGLNDIYETGDMYSKGIKGRGTEPIYRNGVGALTAGSGPETYPSNQMMIVPMSQMPLVPANTGTGTFINVVNNTFRRKGPASMITSKSDAITALASKDDNFLIAPLPSGPNGTDIYGTAGTLPVGPHSHAPYYITYPASTRGGIYDYGNPGGLGPAPNIGNGTLPGEDDNVYDVYTYQNHAYNPGPPEDYSKLDRAFDTNIKYNENRFQTTAPSNVNVPSRT